MPFARSVAVREPSSLPGLEVAPVGEEGLVERGLVAGQRVRRAKEVPAGSDLGDRLDARARRRSRRWVPAACATCWSISASRISFSNDAVSPPSSQPAPWYSRLAPPRTAPQIDIWLSYAACASTTAEPVTFDDRCGRPTRRASCPVASCALHVFGRPERGRARAHVDVRREPAVDHRRTRPDDLGERDHEQRLRVLLGERTRERRGRHRAGEGERGRHDRLTGFSHRDQPVGHRAVQPQRRVRCSRSS